ncbi:hypothetical protein KR018_007422 [Drosophila ironensis]|nr:hypothetical protein KR018_007422 [Drosophila ironensis]
MGHIISTMHKRFAMIYKFVGSRKRKHSTNDMESCPYKIQSPGEYIYRTLFRDSFGFDVIVRALEGTWHLHKDYLSQSPYFKAIFMSWQESEVQQIDLHIFDSNIDVQSLDVVFKSMYLGQINIYCKNVIAILATASFFQMTPIIAACGEKLISNIDPKTAIPYIEVASRYGMGSVKAEIIKWLEMNLLTVYSEEKQLLRQIPINIMSELVASADLYIMEREFTLYVFLRKWMFLQLHPYYDVTLPGSALIKAQKNFFTKRNKDSPFLVTPQGCPYIITFQKLRTQFLTNQFTDLKTIYNDNIIPKNWIRRHINDNWEALLQLDYGPEHHISSLNIRDLTVELFHERCMRFGRQLMVPGNAKWRCPGFNSGLNISLFLESGQLVMQRLHRRDSVRLLSHQKYRSVLVGVTIMSLDTGGRLLFKQTSPVYTLHMEQNDELILLELSPNLVFPLRISLHVLTVNPPSEDFKSAVSWSGETVPMNQSNFVIWTPYPMEFSSIN